MDKINRVTRKQSMIAREKATKIVMDMRNYFRPKYIFANRLVGSVNWNTIIKDKNDMYDIDIQLLLTPRSEENLNNPTKIKDDFFNYLNNKYKSKSTITVQNSTTAITFIDKEHKYSIDFVLIKFENNKGEIIRRNNDKSDITSNKYTWNMLPDYNEAYSRFMNLKTQEKEDLLENKILPRKQKEKQKDKSNPTYKPSFIIFIEEVNNYVNRKRNNRL